MNENLEPQPQPARRSLFGSKPEGPVTRKQVIGLDGLEQKIGYFATAIGVVTSLLILPAFLKFKTTYLTQTAKPSASHLCHTGYHLVATLCVKQIAQTHSYWTFLLVGTAVMSLFLGLATWRRNRPALIVVGILIGALSGTAGLLFLVMSAWLMIRAFRLQRFGDASFKGSNAVARERGRNRAPREKRGSAATVDAKPTPAASKRYTPKKKPRR